MKVTLAYFKILAGQYREDLFYSGDLTSQGRSPTVDSCPYLPVCKV
jgi:hypothetical protein